MSSAPLHLYQVLIQEYNSQETELRIPDEHITKKLEELRGRFAEIADREESHGRSYLGKRDARMVVSQPSR